MMKIVYDNIIFSWQKFGGISVVWQKLLSRILEKPADIQIIEKYCQCRPHYCLRWMTVRRKMSLPASMTGTGQSERDKAEWQDVLLSDTF